MNNIDIKATSTTPAIIFLPAEGKIEITGRSIPENAIDFYEVLLKEVEGYIKKPHTFTEATIQLDYFNSSSSLSILNMLKLLKKLYSNGSEVNVKWIYEEDDDDILNAGKNYQSILNIPFQFIEIQ
jgi:hypothetical protein